MIAGAIVREAWSSLAANRLRTALTMLGIVIGVGAVVLMLAIGRGAQQTVQAAIDSIGANLLVVLPGSTTGNGLRYGSGTAPNLTLSDAQAIAALPSVAASLPVQQGTAHLAAGNANWATVVFGVTPDYFRVRNWPARSGDAFGEADVRSATRVVMLGQTVARSLFGEEAPVGKTVRIKGAPYQVIALLPPKGQNLEGRDQDDSAFVPISTSQSKLFGNPFPGTVRFVMVQAKSAAAVADAEWEIDDLLKVRHRIPVGVEADFSVRNLAATAQAAASSARALSLMLGAIASISLVVGGIGIMNIMLVSVTERTREIGVRMAVGARQREILLQFLLEAVFLCVVGGAVGVALGLGVAGAVAQTADMAVVVTAKAMLAAFGFAAATGIFFGYYPARKAARMRPVEALRHE